MLRNRFFTFQIVDFHLAIISFFLLINTQVNAQVFEYVTGASGTSAGNGLAIDTNGYTYIAGALDNSNTSLAFAQNLNPSFGTSGQNSYGFISKHLTHDGNATAAAMIIASSSGCSMAPSITSAIAERVIYLDSNNIFVLGVFAGCALEFYDAQGNFHFDAEPTTGELYQRKLFIARYTKNLRPLSCQIFGTNTYDTVFAGDVTAQLTASDGDSKVYFAGSFSGDTVYCEAFGSAMNPISTVEKFPINTDHDYEIYIGQIDLDDEQLEKVRIIGGNGHDHASDLVAGRPEQGLGTSDLFLSGTFSDSIVFNIPSLGDSVFITNGFYDVFACQFPDFDIDLQSPVVGGGPFFDQALCLSDNGIHVGGYLSDLAEFNFTSGDTTFNGFGLDPYLGSYVPGARKECGFVFQADYSNHSWTYVDTLVSDVDELSTRVNALADGRCDELYSSIVRGAHTGLFSMKRLDYRNGHLIYNINDTSGSHDYYSVLTKWKKNTTSKSSRIWDYDFYPNNLNYTDNHQNSVFITGIEVPRTDTAIALDIGGVIGGDVITTGWFGDSIGVSPHIGTGDSAFYGNVAGNMHGNVGMFIMGVKDIPRFVGPDTIELCGFDTFHLPLSLDTHFHGYLDTNSIYFTGNGIIDSSQRLFYPPSLNGYFPIIGHFEYMGCDYSGTALIVHMRNLSMPTQASSIGSNWAEGLGAEVAEISELQAYDSTSSYPYYYLAGRFEDTIAFLNLNLDPIEFVSPPGAESGFIAAYGRCGAKWAIHVNSGADAYMEGLEIEEAYGTADAGVNARLYCVGGIADTLHLKHSDGLSMPTNSTNGVSFSSIGSGVEKGIVMEVNPHSGDVNWVYLGGDDNADTNRFHGIRVRQPYILVAGEFYGKFHWNSTWTGLAPGVFDPLTLVMDTGGTVINTGMSLTDKFGSDYDDAGHAVDFYVKNGRMYIFQTGYFGQGPIAHSAFNYMGISAIPAANLKEAYLLKYVLDLSSNFRIQDRLRVYNGLGDDIGHDLVLAPNDSGQADVTWGDNVLFFSGTFSNQFKHDFATMHTLGNTDFDAFVASTNLDFDDQWASREGNGSAFTFESANALDVGDSTLYIHGTVANIVDSSVYYNSGTGASGSSPSFLSGLGVGGRSQIFSIRSKPQGVLVDADITEPNDNGFNLGNDITRGDSALICAGSMSLNNLGSHQKFFNTTSSLHKRIFQTSIVSNGFMSRIKLDDVSYFKHVPNRKEDNQEKLNDQRILSVFPNPSKKTFYLQTSRRFTGKLVISDLSGRVVLDKELHEVKNVNFELNSSAGIYILRVFNYNFLYCEKIIQSE